MPGSQPHSASFPLPSAWASLLIRYWSVATPEPRPKHYAKQDSCAEGTSILGRRTDHDVQSPVRNLYCGAVRGTTESLPSRTSAESANSLLFLISARVTGLATARSALILTA